MAEYSRIRQDDFTSNSETIGTDANLYVIDLVGKWWKIYEAHQPNYGISRGSIIKGNIVRRWDCEAGSDEGKPAKFRTKEEALTYTDKWLLQKGNQK